MRFGCLALTWSRALALAGEGDDATNAAPMRVAANAIGICCISLFSMTSFSNPQNKRSPRLASQRPLSDPRCGWIMTTVWVKRAGKSTATGHRRYLVTCAFLARQGIGPPCKNEAPQDEDADGRQRERIFDNEHTIDLYVRAYLGGAGLVASAIRLGSSLYLTSPFHPREGTTRIWQ